MAVYYLIFFFLLIFAVLQPARNSLQVLLLYGIGFMLFFIAAFRSGDIVRDYENYLMAFTEVGKPIEYFTSYNDFFFFEPFYYLIPSTLKLIQLPYYEVIFFVVFAFLGVYLNLKSIWYLSSFVMLSVLHYFSHFFLLHEMTQIRAGVACGLFLLSIHSYCNKKYAFFAVQVLIALMFHYTSILILFILFFNPNKFSLKKALIVIGISLLLGILKLDFIVSSVLNLKLIFIEKMILTLQAMSEEENTGNVFNIGFIINLILTIILVVNHKKIAEKNQFAYILLKVQILSIFCYCAFSALSVLAFRLYEFYGVVNVITLPFLLYCFRSKVVAYTALATYSLLLLAINLHVVELLKPYKFIFFS